MVVASRRWIPGLALALLVGVVAVLAGCSTPLGVGPEPSCACASLQTQVPWPISEAAARQSALTFFDSLDPEVGRVSQEPVHVLIATGRDGFALVDGDTGKVAEVAFWPAISRDASRRISPREALDAARAFLAGHPDLRATGTANITEPMPGLDLVTWVDAGATSAEIAVNSATGIVASFVDLRAHSGFVAPTLSADAATVLAISAFAVPGAQGVSTPELRVEIDAMGHQRTIWSVGLGVPSATQADVYLSGGVVDVDAATGQTTIVKR